MHSPASLYQDALMGTARVPSKWEQKYEWLRAKVTVLAFALFCTLFLAANIVGYIVALARALIV